MSSPSKVYTSLGQGQPLLPPHDDTFSPVKLPLSNSPTIKSSHRSPGNIIIHPHGLTAKHNASSGTSTKRRNTIHATNNNRSLVNTPLGVSPSASPSRDDTIASVGRVTFHPKYPLTSPRANSKKFNLESIKRSKEKLDTRLGAASGEEKENTIPYTSPDKDINSSIVSEDHISSPIKRSRGGHGKARKIAKVVTSAEVATSTTDHSIQINELFYKEDLVAQLSSAKSSPMKSDPVVVSSPAKIAQPVKTVIDNDSDSDPEDYGRIENTISQTIMPNTSFNNTQLSKLIRSDGKSADYVTPQRLTEPIAKSPTTNQQVRINDGLVLDNDIFEDDLINIDKSDLKDATSPLKRHQLKSHENKENLPIDQGTGIIYEDGTDDITQLPSIERLENEPTINFLLSPNSKPVFSIDQITKMQNDDKGKIEQLKDKVRSKEEELYDLNEELASIRNQLIKTQQQTDDLKDSNESLIRNEEILAIQLKHNERELASIVKNFKIKESLIGGLQKSLQELKNDKALLEFDFEQRKSQFESKTDEYGEEIEILRKSSHELAKERDQLVDANKLLSRDNENLKLERKELGKHNAELKEINYKQEELLNELDNLEHLANDKISKLEKTIERQQSEIAEKVSNYNIREEDWVKTEREFGSKLGDWERKFSQVEEELNLKSRELDDISSANLELKSKMSNFESEIENLKRSHTEEVQDLNVEIQQKESIINEDVSKLNELVEAIEKKKKLYEDEIRQYQSDMERLKQESNNEKQLHKEIEFLRDQLRHQEVESSKKVDEVAAFLHKQYAEKHTRKLGEVRDQYEKELSSASFEKKNLLREIDSFKRKLNRAVEENQKVTDYVHLHKLKYPTSNLVSSDGGSPKRSRPSKY